MNVWIMSKLKICMWKQSFISFSYVMGEWLKSIYIFFLFMVISICQHLKFKIHQTVLVCFRGFVADFIISHLEIWNKHRNKNIFLFKCIIFICLKCRCIYREGERSVICCFSPQMVAGRGQGPKQPNHFSTAFPGTLAVSSVSWAGRQQPGL